MINTRVLCASITKRHWKDHLHYLPVYICSLVKSILHFLYHTFHHLDWRTIVSFPAYNEWVMTRSAEKCRGQHIWEQTCDANDGPLGRVQHVSWGGFGAFDALVFGEVPGQRVSRRAAPLTGALLHRGKISQLVPAASSHHLQDLQQMKQCSQWCAVLFWNEEAHFSLFFFFFWFNLCKFMF